MKQTFLGSSLNRENKEVCLVGQEVATARSRRTRSMPSLPSDPCPLICMCLPVNLLTQNKLTDSLQKTQQSRLQDRNKDLGDSLSWLVKQSILPTVATAPNTHPSTFTVLSSQTGKALRDAQSLSNDAEPGQDPIASPQPPFLEGKFLQRHKSGQ